jgi:protein ImuA
LALAFAFSLAARASGESGKGLCFCSTAGDRQERGELYGHGLAGLGIGPERMLMITAAKEKDLLWTLEEAVASGAFGAVVGSLGAKERLYGFSASRRLKLRAAASQTPLFLLRHRSNGGATAAHGRWRVSALPSWSEGEHAGYALLGPPRLLLTLERMGGLPPQSWEMGFDGTGDFDMAALLENRPARKAGRRRQAA